MQVFPPRTYSVIAGRAASINTLPVGSDFPNSRCIYPVTGLGQTSGTPSVCQSLPPSPRGTNTLCAGLPLFAPTFRINNLRQGDFAPVCAGPVFARTADEIGAKTTLRRPPRRKASLPPSIRLLVIKSVTRSKGLNVTHRGLRRAGKV